MMHKAKTLEYYMALPYTIRVEQNEDGWFAEVNELPYCMTYGDSEAEVLELIEDAKEAWISSRLRGGHPIPEPQ